MIFRIVFGPVPVTGGGHPPAVCDHIRSGVGKVIGGGMPMVSDHLSRAKPVIGDGSSPVVSDPVSGAEPVVGGSRPAMGLRRGTGR